MQNQGAQGGVYTAGTRPATLTPRPSPVRAVAQFGGGAAASVHTDRAPLTIGERIALWFVSASAVGATVSVIIHIFLIVIAALVSVGIASGARMGSRDRDDYELSATTEVELAGIMDTALEADAPVVGDTDLPELATSGVMEGPGGEDRPATGPGIGAISEGLGGAGGGGVGDGKGLGAGGTGGGAASFFGVEAKGSRFAYVVDISGSMRGEKLAAAKIELTESVRSLLEHMSFYVVFFSSDAFAIGNRTKWVNADDTGKRWAADQISQIDSRGGTVPWPAFEILLNMRPAPDAIYFMTDGAFDPLTADQIALRNKGSKKIPIHCITFVDKEAEELMRKIARDSGGTYSHVEGPR